MCECGCGEFLPFAKMPGPGDVVYTLSTYLSVDCGCDNPAGVVVTKVTPKWMEECGIPKEMIDQLPEVAFSDFGDFFVGVIDRYDLEREVLAQSEDEDAADVAQRALDGALRRTAEAEAKRLAKWFAAAALRGTGEGHDGE